MSEWFKEPVLKTGVRESVPWVRIPPHLPLLFRICSHMFSLGLARLDRSGSYIPNGSHNVS
ncbi:protein of unknown function [Agrobacterium pusense]|uniref:Uncharacterized protein n=1 Tax=Agrobacterium pusense TaxID=648995 RepID=U4PTB0_9HYPH|nr:protein of unknown function [Agrobacterium pusense]